MPSNIRNEKEKIPFCLQRIFYNLQVNKEDDENDSDPKAVRTHEMLTAFGWDNEQRNQQQDVDEFNCILSDQLEKQMQGTL